MCFLTVVQFLEPPNLMSFIRSVHFIHTVVQLVMGRLCQMKVFLLFLTSQLATLNTCFARNFWMKNWNCLKKKAFFILFRCRFISELTIICYGCKFFFFSFLFFSPCAESDRWLRNISAVKKSVPYLNLLEGNAASSAQSAFRKLFEDGSLRVLDLAP